MAVLIFDSGMQSFLDAAAISALLDGEIAAGRTPEVKVKYEQHYVQCEGFIVAFNRGSDWRQKLTDAGHGNLIPRSKRKG